MPNPNRRRGFDFERELVHAAQAAGLEARRAYGSNGLSLPGCVEEVDVLVAGHKAQCKRRRALPGYLQIPDGCDVVVCRQDRGPVLVLCKLEDWLSLVANTARPKAGEGDAQ